MKYREPLVFNRKDFMSAEENSKLLSFLKTCDLFQGFSEEELEQLLPFMHIEHFSKGRWIAQEGEMSQNLYLLMKGSAEVVKKAGDYWPQLAVIEEGEWVGEMAHLEQETRSASIRALDQVQLLVCHLKELQAEESCRTIYLKLIGRLTKKVSQRLRKTDQSLVESLQEKLSLIQAHNQVSKTLIHMFILMALWFNFSKLMGSLPYQPTASEGVISAFFVLLFGLSTIYVIYSSGYPLSFYGLTFKRAGYISVEAALYSLPLMLFLVALKWGLIKHVALFEELPLFDDGNKGQSWHETIAVWSLYLLFVPLQELIARGFLQNCFRNFFQGSNRVFYAILSSNLLFALVHTVKGFWFSIATFLLGIFWGCLYEHQRSIVGVCVSHAIIGAFTLFFLNIQKVFAIAG